MPAIKAIKYNNQLCLSIEKLWNTLYSTFNTALHHHINIDVLHKIADKPPSAWIPFSKKEFKSAITNYNNSSTPGPDKLSWNYLKAIVKDANCLSTIINIANACIDYGFWPSHFKRFTTVVIPKPNKISYDFFKSFRLIILLNTLGKLIEKVISKRLQFFTASNNFLYLSQLEGLKFKSTTDVGVTLTHIICLGWIKNLSTSTLTFDIAQFFSSLNHHLLTLILKKAEFNNHVISFFTNYLVGRKTNYLWNNFFSPIFDVNVSVGQESTLSPILSALYLSSFLYIFEKRLKNLNILISIISFVDDDLFISQNGSFHISNSCLFCSYNVMTKLLEKFGLIVKHSKTKVFHFNRSHSNFNPPPLDLTPIKGPVLWPKNIWKYLGFIFDRKLVFHQHINFYSNKATSTIKCMKILGNSNQGINPSQKHLLYRSYILSIILYEFQLWFYNRAPLSYYLKILGKM